MKGKGTRQTKAEFAQLKLDLTKYQERHFPELSNSLPKHGKGAIEKQQLHNNERKYKTRTIFEYEKIQKGLDVAYTDAHSVADFLKRIERLGFQPYFRNDIPQGLWLNGLKHRFSKYGYSKELFEVLEVKAEKETKLLKEFEDIRSRKNWEKDIDIEVESEPERDRVDDIGRSDYTEQDDVEIKDDCEDVQNNEAETDLGNMIIDRYD